MMNSRINAILCFMCLATGVGCTRDANQAGDSSVAINSTISADSTAPTPWVVTSEAAGPFRIGMSADSALLVAGKPAAATKGATCGYLDVDAPVKLMVENGAVVRFDVTDTSVATAEGARVGDPISRIEQLYAGKVRTQPHKYTNGKYLIVVSPRDTMHQLIFETDTVRVTRYRGGVLPAVGYVEGCG
jgi:hypothetical protein